MDTVLESLGWFGCHQRLQLVLLLIPNLDIAMHTMSFMFLGRMFDHKCAESESLNTTGLNVTLESCSIDFTNDSKKVSSMDCPNGYNYSEPQDLSFVSEWDLVCGKEALGEVTQTMLSSGQLLGSILFTFLADKYGRKPIYVMCHISFLVVAVLMAFVPNFTLFLGLKFLIGAFQQGMSLTTCIMLVEMLPTFRRALPAQIGTFAWPCYLLVMTLVCYVCRNLPWRHTQLILSAVSVYSLAQPWLVEESLRWLTVNGKSKKAEKIIRLIAKRNKAVSAEALSLYRKEQKSEDPPRTLESGREDEVGIASLTSFADRPYEKTLPNRKTSCTKSKFYAFFQSRRVMFLTVISCYMWFSDSLTYSGLLMMPFSYADDLYLGFALNVIVEIPAGIPMVAFVDRIGRRRLAWISHLLAGICLLLASVLSATPAGDVPGMLFFTRFVALVGKFAISLGFSIMWLYTPELFPTTIRSTALGISSLAARIGGMVAPFSITLGREWPWLPGIIFAVLCLINPVLVKLLPETHGHELPQQVDDMLFDTDSGSSKTKENSERSRRRNGGSRQNAEREETSA